LQRNRGIIKLALSFLKNYKYGNTDTMTHFGDKRQNVARRIIKQLSIAKKILRGIHPLNWFDGFLDDLQIDLKELNG